MAKYDFVELMGNIFAGKKWFFGKWKRIQVFDFGLLIQNRIERVGKV